MKAFSAVRRAPLVALAANLCLLSVVAALGTGQLAAYSETRSFRDALEGRSMEEAISGPVDRDTSSYGERTGGGAGSTEPSAQKASGADYGQASQAPESANANNAGQMMVNIPANGNLYPGAGGQQRMDSMDDQQQQKSANGEPELEREAGPISPDFPMDTQQQMMEQQQLMRRAKQMMMAMGRSGRLSSSDEMPAAMVMEMVRSMRDESMKRKMAMMRRAQNGGARSGRLQQEQAEEPAEGKRGGNKYESGDESYSNGGGQPMQPSTSSYGKKMGAQANNGSSYGANGEGQQQMGQAAGGPGGDSQQERGYEPQDEQQTQQQEMLGKLQKMARKGMRAGGQRTGDAYRKQPSNMAQSMMMSLANKAAYMANQKQQVGAQRQMAPSMMAQPDAAYGSAGMGSGYGGSAGSQMMRPMQRSGAYQSMGAMRPMRRANQRRPEKKISPAMMNAMLNKMLGGRQSAEEPAAQSGGSYGGRPMGGSPRSMQIAAMLMKQPAPMRAEMIAQMMAMSDNNGPDSAVNYGNGNGNNKRELYKQMMMSAMQQGEEQGAPEMDQQQQTGAQSGYGERSTKPMMAASDYSGEGPKTGYGQDGTSSPPPSYASTSTMNPMSTMSYGAGGMDQQQESGMDRTSGYDGQQQQQQQQDMQGQQRSTDMDTKSMQQERSPMPYGGMGAGMGAGMPMAGPMSNMNRMTPKMNYGPSDSMQGERRSPSSKLMQQVMQMMMMKQMAMNGSQQRKTSYGGEQQQQQQQPQQQMEGGYMGGEKAPMTPMQAYPASGGDRQGQKSDSKNYGAAQAKQPAYGSRAGDEQMRDSGVKGGAGSGSMSMRPAMSMGMSYGQDQQQQRDGEADQQQQQQQGAEDDQYGSAPMGQAEPFAFDFKVEDEASGNNQYRKEESDKNGVVRGSYGYMDSNSGVYRHVEYVADENGFRAKIKSNEPGLSDKTSGRDQQQQQQQQQQADGPAESGTKSASPPPESEGAYQARGSMGGAPPSSSSSLGGSAALQNSQATMAPMMDDKAQQRPMQMSQMNQKMPQEQQQMQPQSYQGQQQQQQTNGELEK